jgi:hypothetical protein
MRFFLPIFVFLQAILSAFDTQEQAKGQMMSDLEFFREAFNAQYAPMEWKYVYSEWDIDTAIDKCQESIQNTSDISVKDYQRIIRNFFQSLGDYHCNISFYSTEIAYLPIQIRGVGNRFFVTSVDQKFLLKDSKNTAIKPGDEILSFDGKPISQAVEEFQKQEFNPYLTLTDIANSHRDFSLRIGVLGHMIPKGVVEIAIKHRATSETKTYKISWLNHDEEISNIIPKGAKSAQPMVKSAMESRVIRAKSMLYPKFYALQKARYKLDKDGIGSRESFIPALGDRTWISNGDTCHFHAYIFKSPSNKKIGYVRIPHFSGSTKEANQFREIIQRFERETSALVVDQVNNPGGSMFYMYALTGCLANKPMALPKHQVALTQKEIFESVSTLSEMAYASSPKEYFGSDIDGYPVTQSLFNDFRKSLEFELTQWNKGNTFTEPCFLYGIEKVQPDKAHYSKPILFLINELDYSCADFLPAILQDNKRAKLFGTRTAGAGGFVLEASHPNLLGIQSFSYTGSLAQRVDLNPIENLGVHPDVVYTITEDDLVYSYRGYVSKLLEEVEKMVK